MIGQMISSSSWILALPSGDGQTHERAYGATMVADILCRMVEASGHRCEYVVMEPAGRRVIRGRNYPPRAGSRTPDLEVSTFLVKHYDRHELAAAMHRLLQAYPVGEGRT
jgi:hypothetical protein